MRSSKTSWRLQCASASWRINPSPPPYLSSDLELVDVVALQAAWRRQRQAARSDPAETLIIDLAAEAGRCGALHQRIGGFVEQLNRRVEQFPQFDHFRNELVGKTAVFNAEAGGGLDQLSDLGDRLRAELARFTLEGVRRQDQR